MNLLRRFSGWRENNLENRKRFNHLDFVWILFENKTLDICRISKFGNDAELTNLDTWEDFNNEVKFIKKVKPPKVKND